MHRREYLRALPIVVVSGCLSTAVDGTREVGEMVDRDGVVIGVTDWDIATDATRWVSFDSPRTIEAPENTVILLVEISARIEGDQPRSYPYFAVPEVPDSPIEVYYRDEVADRVYLWSTREYFRANGRDYDSYEYKSEQTPDEIYPPHELQGWVGAIVSSSFDPAEVDIEINWQEASTTWTLSGPVPTHTNTRIVIGG